MSAEHPARMATLERRPPSIIDSPTIEPVPPVENSQLPIAAPYVLNSIETGYTLAPDDEVLVKQLTLLKRDAIVPDETTATELTHLIEQDHDNLAHEQRERQPELNLYKREFMDAAIMASERGLLPLNESQIRDRLARTKVRFGSDLVLQKRAKGSYAARNGTCLARTSMDPLLTKAVLFHELTHALSTRTPNNPQEAKKPFATGLILDDRKQHGKSLDEVVVDSVASWLLFTSAGAIDDTVPTPQTLSELVDISLRNPFGAYDTEKHATTQALNVHVDLKTLLNAQFKVDNDPYEQDELAKTHALRNKYQQLKRSRGLHATRALRLLDKTATDLRELQRHDQSDPELKSSLDRQAKLLNGNTADRVMPYIIRVIRDIQYKKYEKERQAGIGRVRTYARTRQLPSANTIPTSDNPEDS